jgi:hypothetical protein
VPKHGRNSFVLSIMPDCILSFLWCGCGEDLFGIAQIEVDVNQLIQVHLILKKEYENCTRLFVVKWTINQLPVNRPWDMAPLYLLMLPGCVELLSLGQHSVNLFFHLQNKKVRSSAEGLLRMRRNRTSHNEHTIYLLCRGVYACAETKKVIMSTRFTSFAAECKHAQK